MEAKPPPSGPPERTGPDRYSSSSTPQGSNDPDTLQLLAEEVSLERQTVETGRVRVSKVTHTRDHLIDELLARTSVEVKRVPIGRVIDAVPPVREDAGLTIIPIVEETLVVERRLFLKEEVHIQRLQTTERYQETVKLRHQTAEINRIPADHSGPANEAEAGPIPERRPEDT
jgi:uncharacterized protein (TIGR02271 family)